MMTKSSSLRQSRTDAASPSSGGPEGLEGWRLFGVPTRRVAEEARALAPLCAQTSASMLLTRCPTIVTLLFVGRLGSTEIISLYQSADGLLNPATVDNMPNSLLEALACGVPVISSDVGGVPYIVSHEHTALLVPPGDARQMADAIIRLSSDPELRQALTSAGLAEVRQYAWPEVRSQWLDLYNFAVRGKAA